VRDGGEAVVGQAVARWGCEERTAGRKRANGGKVLKIAYGFCGDLGANGTTVSDISLIGIVPKMDEDVLFHVEQF
jgi:hypothetical protein